MSPRPAWHGSTRKDTLPPDWPQRRERRLRADGYRCQHVREDTEQQCGAHANQVDHTGDRNDHRHEMLQSLCEYHHQQKSSAQGGDAAAARRRAARRRHPGISR
jgi:5-methylcytosine-specific restriction enzyme A